MKKRWTALPVILLAGLLAGCGGPAAEPAPLPAESIAPAPTPAEGVAPTPTPTKTVPHVPTPAVIVTPGSIPFDLAQEPPLTEFSASIAVPDFLTPEQQTLYRRAHCLYQAMFGGATLGIDNMNMFPAAETVEWEWHDEDYYTVGEFRYEPAKGRYQRWGDFDAVVHSVFTDDFWDSRNSATFGNGDPVHIYRDFDGRLGILELERGSGNYYNDNFPDQFRLEEQTEDTIVFTLISPYTEVYPKPGETFEERDWRRENVVEYTQEFPIKMVLTGDGWRFDQFYSGLADE